MAAVVVVSIGIGIGVNTVVFSWIQARVWKPLPGVRHAASLHWVEPRTETGIYPGVSYPEYRDLSRGLRSFRELIAFRMTALYLGESGRVERAYGMLVSDNYFQALELEPALGRFPRNPDGERAPSEADDDPVAVISYGLWQRRFGGAATAVGQPLRVNGQTLTVIGVAPREFQGTIYGLSFDIWLNAKLAPLMLPGSRDLLDRGARAYTVAGQFRDAVSREQAQGEVDALMTRLAEAYPAFNARIRADVLPFREWPRGPQRLLEIALGILQGVMLLLLLAVCGNTANLVLARASARWREMGVRLAVGASPWQIVRLILAENVVLGLLGACLGGAIALWGTPSLVSLPLSGMPIRFQTSVDIGGVAFAMLLGLMCGLAFGAAPAAQLARVDPQTALRTGTRTAGRNGLRQALMAIQVGLALVVLIVGGLFYRSFMSTRGTETGFRREGVMLAAYDLTGRATTQASSRTFAARLLEGLRGLPTVEAAAIASSVPLDIHGLPSRSFAVEGHTRPDPGDDQALAMTVTPGYFALMGIPLLAGTDFADFDDRGAPMQAIVNDEFVRRYLQGVEPLGRRIQTRGRTFAIAGVVKSSLYNAFGEPPTSIVYYSYRDVPAAAGEIHLRARPGAEASMALDVRRIVRDLDAELPVFNVRTLVDHIETNLIFRRVPARLFSVLGPLLLMLAGIGIYAVIAYTVSLRRTEIGVRLALGATPRRLVGQFVGESLTVAGLGALVGWSVAFAIALDLVGAVDPVVFLGVPALLLAVTAFASWLPARRAANRESLITYH